MNFFLLFLLFFYFSIFLHCSKVIPVEVPEIRSFDEPEIKYVSFENEVCRFTLFPNSYAKANAKKIVGKNLEIFLEEVSGIVYMKSTKCKFRYNDFEIEDGEIRIVNGEIDILDGFGKFKGKEVVSGTSIKNGEINSLKPSPTIIFPKREKLRSVYFMWKIRNKAEKIVLEISPDEDFGKVIFVKELEGNTEKFVPESLKLKIFSERYFWRIWTINDNSFPAKGEFSVE